jgi:hypothetical protein
MRGFDRKTWTLALALVLLSSGSAMAGGTGLFIEYGRNIAAPGGDIGDPGGAALDLLDRNELAVGISFDSNLAREDDLFNFRFDIGYHRASFASGVSDAVFGDSNGAMLNGAFGFGLLRTSGMRLWLGPALRMNFDYYGASELFDYQLGIGPQVGLNFNLGGNATVTLSTAYNYKWGWLVDTSIFDAGVESHRDHYVMVNLSFYIRRD